MYIDQVGLEIGILLPLFPVPPCPAGGVFKYPLLTWGERGPLSSILHFQNISSGGRGQSGQLGYVVSPRGQAGQNTDYCGDRGRRRGSARSAWNSVSSRPAWGV